MKTPSTKYVSRFFVLFVLPIFSASATTWVDSAQDASWDNSDNWSLGVPITSSNVVIGTTPTANLITVDTGGPTTVASITFSSGIGLSEIVVGVNETLTVTGNVQNDGVTRHKFSIPFSAGGTATWSGPLEFASNVNVGTRLVTISNDISFTGNNLNFDINSISNYGRFLGAGTSSFSGVTINILGTYTGVDGHSFDLTTSSFTGATIGALPALTGGLVWNTSNFLSSGLLTVSAIPEPAAAGILIGLCVVGFSMTRRRRRGIPANARSTSVA